MQEQSPDLISGSGHLRMTLEITRAQTGITETVELVATPQEVTTEHTIDTGVQQ